jgi:Ca2+-binding EF-hand superfamily protein
MPEYESQIAEWVTPLLQQPKNLASESELREQCRVAINNFMKSDFDNTGTLDFTELKRLCDEIGLPMGKDEEQSLMMTMDKDGNGTLDLEEWVKWWLSRISSSPNPVKQQEAIAKKAFSKFDTDKSGYLDVNEMTDLLDSLGAELSDAEVRDAIAYIDSDNSGQIECQEFVNWWTNRVAETRDSMSLISWKMKKLASKASQLYHSDLFSAVWKGDEELVKQFLENERRLVQSTDESEYGEGWTALHYACYQGHENLVSLLLEAGASVNATNNHGFTPLFYAAQQEHLEIVEMLLDRGADPTATGTQLLTLPLPQTYQSVNIPVSTPTTYFLCPADHAQDSTALRRLFINHDKCSKLPGTVSGKHLTLTISSKGELVLDISVASKNLCPLPIHHWMVELTIGYDDLVDADMQYISDEDLGPRNTTLSLTAQPPTQSTQSITTTLPTQWWKCLLFSFYLQQMNLLVLRDGSNSAFTQLWASLGSLFEACVAVDAKFRSLINLEEKLMAAVLRCSSNDTNTLIFTQTIKNKLSEVGDKGGKVHNCDQFQEYIAFALTTLYTATPGQTTNNYAEGAAAVSAGNKATTSAKTTAGNTTPTKTTSAKKPAAGGQTGGSGEGSPSAANAAHNSKGFVEELKKFPKYKYVSSLYPKVEVRVKAKNRRRVLRICASTSDLPVKSYSNTPFVMLYAHVYI